MTEEEEERDEKLEIIKITCSKLMEHFDSVHIFATRYEPMNDGNTTHWSYGTGNYLTRYGQIKLLVKLKEAEESELK